MCVTGCDGASAWQRVDAHEIRDDQRLGKTPSTIDIKRVARVHEAAHARCRNGHLGSDRQCRAAPPPRAIQPAVDWTSTNHRDASNGRRDNMGVSRSWAGFNDNRCQAKGPHRTHAHHMIFISQ